MTEQARIAHRRERPVPLRARAARLRAGHQRRSAFPFPQRLAQGGLRSLVVAPLLVESQVFGVLIAARREPHSFSSGECEFLRQLSEHVALAAHQAQLYGALQQAYDDLRQTQQAVMQQERLRALGQMASGIAHDINNAHLAGRALHRVAAGDASRTSATRPASISRPSSAPSTTSPQTVARMREFYRQREPQLTLAPVELNELVQQVDRPDARPLERHAAAARRRDRAARPSWRRTCRSIMGVGKRDPRGAHQSRLQRRGCDAGGRHADAAHASSSDEHDAVATSTSHGRGERHRHRHGRGNAPPLSGAVLHHQGRARHRLGLAMVYGIVQRHSADIEIESAPGTGHDGAPHRSAIADAPIVGDGSSRRRHAVAPTRLRILLVDDDPLLLKSLRDTLEADGHVVVAANGGQAGIERLPRRTRRGEPFAVVITDLGMPHVDGRKVAAPSRRRRPRRPSSCSPAGASAWSPKATSRSSGPRAEQAAEAAGTARSLADAVRSRNR